MSARRERGRLPAWLGPMLLAFVPLLGWWAYGLTDVDEGFYGAVAAEMNRRGEWLTPLYNGHPWFEKPILLYWVAKPSLAAFGVWIGPRLPSILATLGTYALLLNFVRRHLSWASARMSLIVLSSSLLFVGVGRMMMTDPLLILCLTGAMFSFWDSLVGDRRWRILTAFWLGLSVLAKGPVGLGLFVISAAVCFWRATELRPRFRGWWIVGTLVLAATVAVWYLPAYLADREVFVQKFLIEQNLQRFSGGDRAHAVPMPLGLVYYLPFLAIGMAPWSGLVFVAWPRASSDGVAPPDGPVAAGGASFDVRRYLGIWALSALAFFTVAGTKLPHYILPCFVPLAIVVGDALSRLPAPSARRWLRFGVVWTLLIAIAANVAFWVVYRKMNGDLHAIAMYARNRGGDVAVYRMSRQDGSAPQMSTTLQETGHPSLLLYLNRDVLDTDDFSALLEAPKPLWIVTRAGRVTDADLALAAKSGLRLDLPAISENSGDYRLWRLESR